MNAFFKKNIIFFLMLFPISSSASECVFLLTAKIDDEMIGDDSRLLSIVVNDVRATSMVYRYIDNDRSIVSIDVANTSNEFQGQGGISRLFSEMIRIDPQIRSIQSTLMNDNLSVARQHDDRTGTELERCIKMVTFTPAYKTRVRLGFSKITECSVAVFGILMTVER